MLFGLGSQELEHLVDLHVLRILSELVQMNQWNIVCNFVIGNNILNTNDLFMCMLKLIVIIITLNHLHLIDALSQFQHQILLKRIMIMNLNILQKRLLL